jgi:hypothetical protein
MFDLSVRLIPPISVAQPSRSGSKGRYALGYRCGRLRRNWEKSPRKTGVPNTSNLPVFHHSKMSRLYDAKMRGFSRNWSSGWTRTSNPPVNSHFFPSRRRRSGTTGADFIGSIQRPEATPRHLNRRHIVPNLSPPIVRHGQIPTWNHYLARNPACCRIASPPSPAVIVHSLSADAELALTIVSSISKPRFAGQVPSRSG